MDRFWVLPFSVILCFSVISSTDSINSNTQTFIVRIENDVKPSVFSDVKQWYKSTLQSLTKTTTDQREDVDLVHIYKTVFHGFSARLTTQQAKQLKTHLGVLSVLPDRIHQIQTTRSPQFLGLSTTNPAGLLTESDFGSNVIIGVLDTGIWPERHSFHDKGLGLVPSHWKGECVEGVNFTKSLCNKKIIGARYFTDGAINNTDNIMSARDNSGHGTHTASTAAGRQVGNASLFGYAEGVAVGVAPKARIAVYKVCWSRGCVDSDILAGFDKAVEDGVDVISLSFGGERGSYSQDPIAIASFGAAEKGILVSASAGNGGPEQMTVGNFAPWITTVGASTIDRRFSADLLLEDGRVITGASLYSGKPLPKKTYLPLIYAGDFVEGGNGYGGYCLAGSLEKNVRGKIVVCDKIIGPRVAKGEVVSESGGAGVIIANVDHGDESLIADSQLIPSLTVTGSARQIILRYINSTENPRATMVFRGTRVGVTPAPVIAFFSSRGPSRESFNILKPDLIAPGVNILAAWPDSASPTGLTADTRTTEFNILSGTSMACPHVSGIAALLKGAHPDWSPAMIRSALMTTAYTHDHEGKPLLEENYFRESTIWTMGAGHVDPERAVDPGLVYDLKVDDYVNFLCASNYSGEDIKRITRRTVNCNEKQYNPWDLNHPAIAVTINASRSIDLEFVVTRTVTHVSKGSSSYKATVTDPKDVTVSINPPKMEFAERGEKQSYMVHILAKKNKKVDVPSENFDTELGKLTWTDGKHIVTSPIVVVWQN